MDNGRPKFKSWVVVITMGLFISMAPTVMADIYINVMAVNGADSPKATTVKYNLPGELKASDIIDANNLQLEYNVNDANYYVHGEVNLKPKESKTFRIRIKDVWKVTPAQVANLKSQIDEGYERLGKVRDLDKSDALKEQLIKKLDYIIAAQEGSVDSVEKRIDAYRTYAKEMKRIENDALSVEYWRSNPGEVFKPKIMRMLIDVENPPKNPTKLVKQKHFLPQEVKPEHVVDSEGFEVRFDQQKQQSFLFKEEEMTSGEKKRYSVGILDIWSVAQGDINYLRFRAKYVMDFLKGTRFDDSAKFLFDRVGVYLLEIEKSQAKPLPIVEHISLFRVNQKNYTDAQRDVETLEKLLALFREDLEKSKVQNVLQKVKSLNSVANVAEAVFNKKLEVNKAWEYIGWVLLIVGLITFVSFLVWSIRSKDKKLKEEVKGPEAV